jgi:4-hydroxy-tetrahydrodipicolinate synthase
MLLDAGIAGVCVAGTTGEFPRLSPEAFQRLVRCAVEVAGGRVPVLAGVGGASLDGSIARARSAAANGADAVLAPPPIYFPYGQSDLRRFYEQLAAACEVPLLLYNIPPLVTALEAETVAVLLGQGTFAGIKDSGGRRDVLEAALAVRRVRPLAVLTGHDTSLLESLDLGADGALSGIAACAPEVLLTLFAAQRRSDRVCAEKAQRKINHLVARLDAFPPPVGIRLALEARGVPVGPHAVPVTEAREFALWFEKWLED